jgi:outer membrane protein assembly factor BamA
VEVELQHLVAVPPDDELESQHARIGQIEVEVEELFQDDVRALAAPYRIANGLHIGTRRPTITQQLLFRTGEPYRRSTLDETERMLRAQRYLREATIEPIRYNEDGTVDLRVRVHDVWTLSPGFSFGRKGGENSTRFEFEDTNLLGFGKQITVSRTSDVDRSAWRLAYTDPHVLGSWWRLSGAHGSLSDGSETSLALARPFYSLDSRWSLGGSFADTTRSVARYSLGEAVDRLQMHERNFDLSGGVSAGLSDGWTRRWLAGVRHEQSSFSDPADLWRGALPEDRTLTYPWVGVELVEDSYLETHNLNQIGRTEDMYLGRSLRAELGFASAAFGSTRDALMLKTAAQMGTALGADQYLIHVFGVDARLENGALRNAVVDASTSYYRRQSARRVLFASVTASLASQLDAERQLVLGGDNGLRGYPLRYQSGGARALFTIEERFYSNWQLLKLFDVGAAAFFDAGRTWGRDLDSVQLLIETKRSF